MAEESTFEQLGGQCAWSAANMGLEETAAGSRRAQWARLGLLFSILRTAKSFHLCFERVTLAAGWRTDGVEALVKNGRLHPSRRTVFVLEVGDGGGLS